jgi:hypothetical protein
MVKTNSQNHGSFVCLWSTYPKYLLLLLLLNQNSLIKLGLQLIIHDSFQKYFLKNVLRT